VWFGMRAAVIMRRMQEVGWYIKTDDLRCRVVFPGVGSRGLISNWCCDCLEAGIHYVVMGRKHNV